MPPREPVTDSFFGDDSVLRRVHREALVALGGGRALLTMAAHPVAFEGFFHSTGALDDPYGRLRRTSAVLDEITFGSRERAERMTGRVRAMHRRVQGELPAAAGRFPAGTPYRADDPDLLLWILACLADSSLVVYERYVTSLTPAERDAYWQDFKVLGRLFGLRDADMPATGADFDAYMAAMLVSDDLEVTAAARELGREIVLRPPVPIVARPLVELVTQVTVGLLPARIRRGYGLSWDPARALAARGGAEYVRRVLLPLLPERVRLVPSARAA